MVQVAAVSSVKFPVSSWRSGDAARHLDFLPADQFYGDRSAGIADPSGNSWWIATHVEVEDVSHEDMEKRARDRAQKAA